MKKYSYPRSRGKLFKRNIDTYLSDRKSEICSRASSYWYVGEKSTVLQKYRGLEKM